MGIFSGFGKLFRATQLNAMARRLFDDPPPPADARIHYGDDPLQFADLRLPKERAGKALPVVVVVHGGFWRSKYNLDHIGLMCAALTAAGVATWSVEYRRLSDGGGWPNTMLDVGKACDHLREIAARYNLDLSRVVVTGHSAGGQLAAWIAGRHNLPEDDPLFVEDPLPVAAAVPLAGVMDLRLCYRMKLSNDIVVEFMGGTPDEVPERYASASPADLLPLGVKQVLIHGTSDPNVPYEISDLYTARAREMGDDVQLIKLKGTGHFEVIDPQSKEWAKVRDAILAAIPA